jgi:hypothetical protein
VPDVPRLLPALLNVMVWVGTLQLAEPAVVMPVENWPALHCPGVAASAVAVAAFPVAPPGKLPGIPVKPDHGAALAVVAVVAVSALPVVLWFHVGTVPPRSLYWTWAQLEAHAVVTPVE